MEYISISSIQLFLNCQYCWKLHYIDKLQMPSNEAMDWGSYIHSQVDKWHKGLLDDETDITPYTAKIKKDYRLESEKKVTQIIKIDDYATDLPICLIIDGLTEKGLCDLKTGSKKPKPSLQSDIYGAWYFMTFNKEPEFEFNWFHNNKVKNSGFMVTKPEMIEGIQYINQIIKDINKSQFNSWNADCRWWHTHHPDCIFA